MDDLKIPARYYRSFAGSQWGIPAAIRFDTFEVRRRGLLQDVEVVTVAFAPALAVDLGGLDAGDDDHSLDLLF